MRDLNTQQTPTKLKHDVAAAAATNASVVVVSRTDQDQKHALAMAVATTEAAMATAQAAVEVARLSKPSTATSTTSTNHNARDHYAAIVIQTAFRGYLARRALPSVMVLDQRIRSSLDGRRKSNFSDTASVWESRYLQDISDRKSVCNDLCGCFDSQEREAAFLIT
ncbi:hypothetical protein RIF29_09710 [Crotalaria pallida]|uniref:Uncharacterized protein n=1 Tax=Crotalaria pallida TaxID=3830 RepID=A0AAN9IJR9_CROPI